MKKTGLGILMFLMYQCVLSQRTDSLLVSILKKNTDTSFRKVLDHPSDFRLQIIYTRIDRDERNKPVFHDYFFDVDPDQYFNPASMVKMPLAFLSLEKLHRIPVKGIDRYTPMRYDSSQSWQHGLTADTTAASGLPSIAQFIRRAFLISENDPYNRMYQFIGQRDINTSLHEKGYNSVQIVRQFLGLTEQQNRYTNGISFLDIAGNILYRQQPAVNTDSIDFSRVIKIGKGYYNSADSLITEPFDFTKQNNVSLRDFQRMLRAVLFPQSVEPKERFALTMDDYRFLKTWLSQFPSETDDPKYDDSKFYDSYVKFFFRDSTHRMPNGVRVFNKVGWSYGFLTDVSYVADFKNRVEFMLAATIYVNSDGIINDDKYEYDDIGHPFLYQLGQTIYRHELKRKRAHRPDLSAFKIKYGHRNPDDARPPLSDVDN